MLSNVVDLTNVLNQLLAEGYDLTPSMITRLSPYMSEHIRRFGQYVVDMEQQPEPLTPQKIDLPPI